MRGAKSRRAFAVAVGLTGVAAGQSPIAEFEGSAVGDGFGAAVAGVGDVDGDGFDDVVIGAFQEDANGFDAGAVRVVSGRTGETLVLVAGAGAGAGLGRFVGRTGDVDGDGFPDLVTSSATDLRVLSGVDGSPIHLVPTGSRPRVSGAGDMNADGFADVAFTLPPTAGGATVVSGATGAKGTFPGLAFGIAGPGDLDGDGHDDLAVGFPDVVGTPGRIDVFSGATGQVVRQVVEAEGETIGYQMAGAGDVDADGTPDLGLSLGTERVAVRSGVDMSLLHVLDGDPGLGMFGDALDGAGDLDGDGRDDVIVGAPGLFLGFPGYARAYSGADGSVLFGLVGSGGPATGDALGAAVARLGDVNGDGLADVAVGAPQSPLSNPVGPGYVWVVSHCAGGVVDVHGDGCPGSSGFVPELRVLGCPLPRSEAEVTVRKALGLSIALVFVGHASPGTPLWGTCALHVDALTGVVFQLPLSAGGPGHGEASVPVTVPSEAPSGPFHLQGFVFDPAAAGGVAVTNGVVVAVP
ncbi:MAG: VCBS repeat-containing protein [Planctomycetota bacterium JB042]